jgi:hypothetical protein
MKTKAFLSLEDSIQADQDLEENARDSAVVDLPPRDLKSLQQHGFRLTLAKKFGLGLKHPIEVFYLSR